MSYAKGYNAFGRCGKCGDKVPYLELRGDGQVKGLRVCSTCFDIKHPQEIPVNMEEGIALKNPAPDTDVESPTSTTPIAETLFPGEHYFGGQT